MNKNSVVDTTLNAIKLDLLIEVNIITRLHSLEA